MVIVWMAAALAAPPDTAVLVRPFEGDWPASGVFDHRLPEAQVDKRQLTAWGVETWGRAGHAGWDWSMPEGTPIFAAADGRVKQAGDEGEVDCGARVAPVSIRIIVSHTMEKKAFQTAYLHLSRVVVAPGEEVRAGQLIGYSGNTGCSSGPHLHFGVVTKNSDGRQYAVDPYGWDAPGPDPRLAANKPSWFLWKEGQAPLVYRDLSPSKGQLAATDGPVISMVRGFAWADHQYPNNEFVELSLGGATSAKRLNLSGYKLRNNAGDAYTFPPGTVLRAGHTLRVYSGEGQDTKATLFWGRETDAFVDNGDCAQLLDGTGKALSQQHSGRVKEQLCEAALPLK